jgi:hypothetical protein
MDRSGSGMRDFVGSVPKYTNFSLLGRSHPDILIQLQAFGAGRTS